MTATMKMMTVVVAALQRLQEGRREGIIVFGGDGLTAVQGQWEESHRKVARVGEPLPSRCGRRPDGSDTSQTDGIVMDNKYDAQDCPCNDGGEGKRTRRN